MADENNEVKEVKDEQELAPFDPTKKKKKKKVVIQDPIEDSAESLPEKSDSLPANDGLESSFAGLKKKKKKPVEISSSLNEESLDAAEDLDENANDEEEAEGIDLQPQQQRYPWEGSDRDYIYDELLGRVFNILRENNPELAGDRRRTVMRPPQVLREGTKKTVFVNFMDLCKTMHRQPDHVMNFLLAELGTSGSLDGQQRLVVKGRFAPKNFAGNETQKLSEPDAVTVKLEEAHHLNVSPGVGDSAGIGSSGDGKAETQPEVPASVGMQQSGVEVQPESDPTPDRYTYVSSNQQETPQDNGADKAEKSLPFASDDSKTKPDASPEIISEAENVRLEAVPKPEDGTVISDQHSSVLNESEVESAAPKDPATENAPEDGIEQEVKTPGSLLKEYNLDGNGTESNGSSSAGEQLTNETEALPNSTEGLKDGYMTEDGKLVLDFLDAIHAAEERQSHLEAQVFAEKLRTLKEKYENELRDLRARELMRIEEAAILDKELKREKTKAAAAIKSIQERMEDKLKTEIEQKESEAQLALSKAEEMAKAELTAAIVKEKAAQIEKMAEADLNIKALHMAFYARSEEARKSHSVHKLALGALALEDSLSKGLPIHKEIGMLQSYLEGTHEDSVLDLVLSSLPEEAKSKGTDTTLQLNQKFDTLKGTLRHFSLIPPGGGGILAHSLAHIASWLKFKEVDQANGGIESVIKKVDNYLAEEKLAEAAAALEEGVKGSKAEEVVSEWVRLARNRAITEQAVTILRSYATCASLT